MLDIKPDNIKADYREDDEGMIITKTQLTDLENAAYLPNDRYLKSMLMGNEAWRSPEAVFRSKLGKPSDMYSFGLVVCSRPSTQSHLSNLGFSVSTPASTISSSAKTPTSTNVSRPAHCRI
jgi:serine/threonine protein kinase